MSASLSDRVPNLFRTLPIGRLHFTYIQLHNTYGGVHLTYIRLHPTYAVAHHMRKEALPHTRLHITHVWQHTAYAVAHLRRMAALRLSSCTSHTNGSTPHTRLHIAHVWQHSTYAVAHTDAWQHSAHMAAIRIHMAALHIRIAVQHIPMAAQRLHYTKLTMLGYLYISHILMSQILTLKTALPVL